MHPLRLRLLILTLFLAIQGLRAQTKNLLYEAQAGLIQPSYPFGAMGELFNPPYHSQYMLGLTWKKTMVHRIKWMYGVRTGLLYHRFIQWGIPVQGHVGGYATLAGRLGLEAGILGGYLHSFPLTETYKMKDGHYERSGKLGRPQGQVGVQVGPSFQLGQARHELFVHYQFWVQVPFINSYVPALPYNGVSLGFRFHQKPEQAPPFLRP
jgi:hypothetical protein